MQIDVFRTVDEARALLTGSQDRIITSLSAEGVLRRARSIEAAAFDFCGSLAVGNQWQAVKKYLREDLREEDDADRDWYFHWSADNHGNGASLSDPDWFMGHSVHANASAVEGAWLARSFRRFVDGKMHQWVFENAGKEIVLREGARELFDLISTRVVISMGMEQVIQSALTHNNLTAAVAAGRLIFGPDGVLTGYHPNLVVGSSKRAALERFMELNRLPVQRHLVLGDTFIDTEMMPDGAFNVWILPRKAEFDSIAAFRNTHFEAMLKRVTIVLSSNSLMPLVNLIRQARAGK